MLIIYSISASFGEAVLVEDDIAEEHGEFPSHVDKLLDGRRGALISVAVTGKIDVRETTVNKNREAA